MSQLPAAHQSTVAGSSGAQVVAWLPIGLLCAASFASTLLATRQGIGLRPDSAFYLSAGLNLAQGEGLITHTGTALTTFPPGLSTLVAVAERSGLDVGWSLRLVHATAFAMIVLLSALLLARHLTDRRLIVGATAFVSFNVALLEVMSVVWSEAIFTVILLAFVLALERSLVAARPLGWTVAAASLASMSFFVRYVGALLIVAGLITLVGGRWAGDRRKAVGLALAFAAMSSLGPALWLARNVNVDGTPMGPRYSSSDTIGPTVLRIVETIGNWVVPLAQASNWVTIGFAVVACVIGLAMLGRRTGTTSRYRLLPLGVLVSTYLVGLTVAQLTTAFNPIGTRLMSPILAPLVIITTVVIERARPWLPTYARTFLSAALIAILALQAVIFTRDAVRFGAQGVGYASDDWQNSELSAVAAELPNEVVLYSNLPEAVWAVTRREPIQRSPLLLATSTSDQPIEISDRFIEDASCRDTYLVWFNDANRPYVRTPEQLSDVVTVQTVGTYDDGTLYRLTSLGRPNC